MAKKKISEPEVELISPDPDVPRPRLKKLIVRNFRCIGDQPVEIDLDDVVVLVGPNNVGKSSILKAYEVVMSHGSKAGELLISDFPNSKMDDKKYPVIELHTIVYDKTPGEKWIGNTAEGEMLVRERWIWKIPGSPKRQGWDTEENDWSEHVPWGAPNVAKTRRPEPHRVNAFDAPEVQADHIKKILMTILIERVKAMKSDATTDEVGAYNKLLDMVKDLQKKIISESKIEIEEIEKELSQSISEIFPDYKVLFDAKPEEDLDKSIVLFKAGSDLLMGPSDGYLSKIELQGSGARRTLLWTALKIISENIQKSKAGDTIGRPHVLLLDEPEICLHPNAIREACNVLYDLPKSGNWQVMTTTHCPVFIDVSKDNTTIVRVEKTPEGKIQGTTVFRPDSAELDDDDKKRLKLLNMCDPYVMEFFFGGRSVVVEGDTEYTAFNYIKSVKPEKYKDIHVVRARGKATIVALVKILNHFAANYSVLHDSDMPTIKTKKGNDKINPAWSINEKILGEISNKPKNTRVRLLASIPNFEKALLGEEIKYDKPYNFLVSLQQGDTIFKVIEQLLDSLVDFDILPPENCVEWDKMDDLLNSVKKLE